MNIVIIRYNKILDKVAKGYCSTLPKYRERASIETDIIAVEEKIRQFKAAWEPIQERVFTAISDKAQRTYPYSAVNVNIISVIDHTEAFSMMIPYTLSIDQFIITLSHELVHLSRYRETPQYKEQYKNETVSARQHVIIHAILEYIWKDILNKPEYLAVYKDQCTQHRTHDYSRAWEIVEKKGYESILNTAIL